MKILIQFKKRVLKIIIIMCYIMILIFSSFKFALIVSKNKDRTIKKYKKYYVMMMSWLEIVENGFALDKYLKENGFSQVAIYGGREIGQHLIKSLQDTDIIVEYVIDRTIYSNHVDNLPVYRPNDKLPVVDAVIVTPIWDYIGIREKISEQIKCPIISLEDIIAGGKNEQSGNSCAKLSKL